MVPMQVLVNQWSDATSTVVDEGMWLLTVGLHANMISTWTTFTWLHIFVGTSPLGIVGKADGVAILQTVEFATQFQRHGRRTLAFLTFALAFASLVRIGRTALIRCRSRG